MGGRQVATHHRQTENFSTDEVVKDAWVTNIDPLRVLQFRADRCFGSMNLHGATELFADGVQVIPRVTPLSCVTASR
jgi:hypothetical protein